MNLNLKKDIKPLSSFRTKPNAILRQVRENHRPVVITDRGQPAAVVLGIEEYERQREKMELMEAILEGERDFNEGRSRDIEQVYRDTRSWLAKR